MDVLVKNMKKIMLKVFLIFQLTMALIFLMQYITMSLKQTDLENKANALFKTENIFHLNITSTPFRKKTIDKTAIDKFYNYLIKDKDIKVSLFNKTEMNILDESKKVQFDYSNYKNFDINDYNSYDENRAGVVYINDEFCDMFNVKIAEGNELEFNNFNKNEITPILAGQAYKQVYKLNDFIKLNNKTFRIVGFLEPGQYCSADHRTLFLDYLFLDNVILIPQNLSDIDNINYKLQFLESCLIKYTNSSEKNILKDRIEHYLNECNIEAEVIEYATIKQNYLYSLGVPKLHEKFIFFTIIICSIVGLSITMIIEILNKKNEIGIKLAVGYGKLRIFTSLLKQYGSIILISFFITIAYYKAFNIEDLFPIKVGFQNSLILFIICLGILIITTIIPFKILMRFTPKDLIGGAR